MDNNNNNKHEFCPIRDILAQLSDKWSLLVIITLSKEDKMRFNEIQKEIEGISQRMLTVTLKSLQSDGLISRKAYAEIPPRVEYRLTEMGYSLLEPLKGLVNWAKSNHNKIQIARNNYRK